MCHGYRSSNEPFIIFKTWNVYLNLSNNDGLTTDTLQIPTCIKVKTVMIEIS